MTFATSRYLPAKRAWRFKEEITVKGDDDLRPLQVIDRVDGSAKPGYGSRFGAVAPTGVVLVPLRARILR